jgi:hypothetical protein
MFESATRGDSSVPRGVVAGDGLWSPLRAAPTSWSAPSPKDSARGLPGCEGKSWGGPVWVLGCWMGDGKEVGEKWGGDNENEMDGWEEMGKECVGGDWGRVCAS